MPVDRFEKSFTRYSGFQSNQQLRPRFGGHNVPHFGFSPAAGGLLEFTGVGIVGMDLDGKLFFGKRNFTSSGKSLKLPVRVPRHSGGMHRQLSPSDLPVRGPVATRESRAVSQASPIGSGKFVFSGKIGASDRVPHGRGLKIGSIRVRTGSTAIRMQLRHA